MKPGIHPTWYPDAHVTCACGNTWTTGSTKKEIHTDVCNNCHPFFTGEQRIVDTAGQVERFMKRISAKEQIAATQPAPEEKKAKKEKRRDHKAPGAAPVVAAPRAPVELPIAEIVEQKPIVQAPAVPAIEEIKPMTVVEEPAVAAVEPPAEVVVVEEIVAEAPAAVVEEKLQVVVEPIAIVETPSEIIVVEEVVAEAPAEEEKKVKARAAKAAPAKKPAAKKVAAKKPAAKAAAKPKAAHAKTAGSSTAKKPAAAKAKASTTKKSKK